MIADIVVAALIIVAVLVGLGVVVGAASDAVSAACDALSGVPKAREGLSEDEGVAVGLLVLCIVVLSAAVMLAV